MVNLTHKISLALLCTACLEHLATAQEAPSEPLPISLDADSSSFSQETGTMVFRGLQISQGSMKIEADEAIATGLDFEKSEWSFNGNVNITIDSARINSDRAADSDGISWRVLLLCDESMALPLHLIFTNIMSSSVYLDAYRLANITPIYKKGNKQLVSNYRPISLLPICGKIHEKVIFNQMYS